MFCLEEIKKILRRYGWLYNHFNISICPCPSQLVASDLSVPLTTTISFSRLRPLRAVGWPLQKNEKSTTIILIITFSLIAWSNYHRLGVCVIIIESIDQSSLLRVLIIILHWAEEDYYFYKLINHLNHLL